MTIGRIMRYLRKIVVPFIPFTYLFMKGTDNKAIKTSTYMQTKTATEETYKDIHTEGPTRRDVMKYMGGTLFACL